MNLYDSTSISISKQITRNYSTSFYFATSLLKKEKRDAIHSIYGFVRVADEIVDSFHDYDKEYLLNKFEDDYYEALKHNISTNQILHSFQLAVKKYNISDENVQSFLQSMKNDLKKTEYKTKSEIDEYIYGSADVVGLMCLNVFCDGDYKKIEKLEYPAMKLGSAFQKVNFLRDFKDDVESLDRKYFPNVDRHNFNEKAKSEIINEIENDFKEAYKGIKQLPSRSRLAVLLAYYYYNKLLNKLKYTPANKIIEARIRVSNITKLLLLFKASTVYKLNLM